MVMSAEKVVTRGTGFIATRSTPDKGHFLANGSNSRCDDDVETLRTDDQTVHGHCLACHLEPSPGSSAQVNTTSRRFQEGEFLVQLDQLERGTCTVTLFSAGQYGQEVVTMKWFDILCELVVLIQSTLPCFFLCLAHLVE